MQNNQNHFQYLNVLLRSPKASRVIQDAWESPIGSTKRSQGKALLSVARNKMMKGSGGPGYDGMGGPDTNPLFSTGNQGINIAPQGAGVGVSGIPQNPDDEPYVNLLNMSKVTPAPTTGTIPSILKPAPKMQQQEPASNYGFDPNAPIPSLLKNLNSVPWAVNAGVLSLLGSLYAGALNTSNAFNKALGVTSPEYSGKVKGSDTIFGKGSAELYKYADSLVPTVKSQTSTKTTGYVPPVPQANVPVGTPGGYNLPSEAPTAAGTQSAETTAEPTQVDDATFGAAWQNLALLTKKYTEAGVPANVILKQLLSDPETLASLGFTQSQIGSQDIMNDRMSLNDLQKKYTDLLNKKANLQDMGNYLVPDLQDYVKGRDQYVAKIDTMIEEAQNAATNGQLAPDPDSQMKNQNYLNMLYGLKGEQNKRYMDMINASITKYNADLTSVDNELTNITALYNQAVEKDLPIAQEEYNSMVNSLNGFISFYSKSSGDPYSSQAVGAAADTAKNAIDSTKATNLSTKFTEISPLFINPNTKAFEPNGLSDKIKQTVTWNNQQPKDVVQYLEMALSSLGTSADGTPTTDLGLLKRAKNAVVQLQSDGTSEEVLKYPGITKTLLTDVVNTSKPAFTAFVSSHENELRDAIEDLISDVKNPFDESQVNAWKNESSYASAFSSDSTFADELLSYYRMAMRDEKVRQNPLLAFSQDGKKISKIPSSEFSSNIVGGIMALWGAETANVSQ